MPRIAPQQNRSAGEHLSSEVAAPARGAGQATLYRVTLDPAPADLADPTLTIDTALEGSIDGVTWTPFARIEGWTGGIIGRDGQPVVPRLSWMASDNRLLTRVRVRWRQSKPARVGASLDSFAVDVSASQRSS